MAEVAVGEVMHSPVFKEVVMERKEICCESCEKTKTSVIENIIRA
jgi:hypothetical protein